MELYSLTPRGFLSHRAACLRPSIKDLGKLCAESSSTVAIKGWVVGKKLIESSGHSVTNTVGLMPYINPDKAGPR